MVSGEVIRAAAEEAPKVAGAAAKLVEELLPSARSAGKVLSHDEPAAKDVTSLLGKGNLSEKAPTERGSQLDLHDGELGSLSPRPAVKAVQAERGSQYDPYDGELGDIASRRVRAAEPVRSQYEPHDGELGPLTRPRMTEPAHIDFDDHSDLGSKWNAPPRAMSVQPEMRAASMAQALPMPDAGIFAPKDGGFLSSLTNKGDAEPVAAKSIGERLGDFVERTANKARLVSHRTEITEDGHDMLRGAGGMFGTETHTVKFDIGAIKYPIGRALEKLGVETFPKPGSHLGYGGGDEDASRYERFTDAMGKMLGRPINAINEGMTNFLTARYEDRVAQDLAKQRARFMSSK